MADERRIRPATAEDEPAILRLLDKLLGEMPEPRRKALWNWRHLENPARSDAIPRFLVLEQGGEVFGVHGFIPLRIQLSGEPMRCACACDFAADPAARAGGLLLKRAAMSTEIAPVHLSTSANDAARRLTVALGGGEVPAGLRSYVLPLRASDILKRRVSSSSSPLAGRAFRAGLTAMAPALDLASRTMVRSRRPARSEGVRVREITTFDHRFDALWARVADAWPVALIRDQAYLNWRYRDWPFGGIQCFSLEAGDELLGYAVVSQEEGVGGTGLILELVADPADPAWLEALTAEAVRHLMDAGASVVSARTSEGAARGALLAQGFRERTRDYSPVTWSARADLKDTVGAEGAWYLSLGDGDAGFDASP